jgi:2-oxo-4-hydroxy-4-carboxy-5-ureidoimidazoline decarboxylase
MEPSQRLDLAPAEEARQLLTTCCGSSAWVLRMLRRRPFVSTDRLVSLARDEWVGLTHTDWLEAFAHHPKIGDRDALARRFPGTAHPSRAESRELSELEQRGVDGAPAGVLDQLAAGNRAYQDKFGYIFIVCATGRTAAEMLELLRARLPNDAATEIRIAADEQAKITELRLRSLGAESRG